MYQDGPLDPPVLVFLAVPQSRKKTFRDAAFSHYPPSHYKSLLEDQRGAENIDYFKCKPKTYLFCLSFMQCLIMLWFKFYLLSSLLFILFYFVLSPFYCFTIMNSFFFSLFVLGFLLLVLSFIIYLNFQYLLLLSKSTFFFLGCFGVHQSLNPFFQSCACIAFDLFQRCYINKV